MVEHQHVQVEGGVLRHIVVRIGNRDRNGAISIGDGALRRRKAAELCDFLREYKLERVGAFAFSPEEGTEAAAVTVIVVEPSGGEFDVAEFIANRPFLYTINENSTGAIFFIGQYMGETTSHISDIQVQQPDDNAIYDLTGRRLTTPPTRGICIQNGQKIVVRELGLRP